MCDVSECSLNVVALYSFTVLTFNIHVLQSLIIKLNLFPVPVRLHSGSGKFNFVIVSPYFAIFKNVAHSLEPGETPSYSASHQAPNYAQRS